ncbi:hypothetical protein EJB05_45062, partial [Eragrostis curvula]
MASILVFIVLCSCCSIAHGSDEQSFIVVPTSSFEPESACSRASVNQERSNGAVSMPLVHRYGPCAPWQPTDDKPSLTETLHRNRARWSYIMSMNNTRHGEKAVLMPTHLGNYVDSLEYIVTVGYGTPAVEQVVLLDTGSSLSWVQCKPCNPGACSPQKDPLFDPSRSSTYKPVPCNSDVCRRLAAGSLGSGGCVNGNQCKFAILYADGSITGGVLSSEKLTLTSTRTVNNFLFGCGHDSRSSEKYDGLLGFGRSSLSLVSQTAHTEGRVFSYCLPGVNSRSGFLTLGVPMNHDPAFVFTPMGTNPFEASRYVVSLTGNSVGGRPLDIKPSAFAGGMIIDSGRVVTGLPSTAYNALKSAVRQAMAAYPLLPNGPLETCYNLTGYRSVAVPKVSLVFGGGATINLDVPNGILVEGCLAFEMSGPDASVAVLGNVNQRNFEVLFDVEHARVGFRANAC